MSNTIVLLTLLNDGEEDMMIVYLVGVQPDCMHMFSLLQVYTLDFGNSLVLLLRKEELLMYVVGRRMFCMRMQGGFENVELVLGRRSHGCR